MPTVEAIPTTSKSKCLSQDEVLINKGSQRLSIETGESRRNSDQSDLIGDHRSHSTNQEKFITQLVNHLNDFSDIRNSNGYDYSQEDQITQYDQENCESTEITSRQQLIADFPDKSEISKSIQEWLNEITSHGFLRWVQAKYVAEISYEAEEEQIDFEYGIERIFDPYYAVDLDDIASIEGKLDKKGYPLNRASVTTHSGDSLIGIWRNGTRCGNGKSLGENMTKYGLELVQGPYENGILHGFGRGKLNTGHSFEGFFNNGYLEGPVVGVPETSSLLHSHQVHNLQTKDFEYMSHRISNFKKGLPSGYAWQELLGGGWIHGKVDWKGDLTGDNVLYLYPDFFTCLVGKFQKGVMLEARLSYIESLGWENEIMFVEAHYPPLTDHVYKYSPSSPHGFTVDTLVPDPYESMRTEVRRSSIQGAGEGLFATRDILQGDIISFYHGLRYPARTPCKNKNFDYQIFLDWVRAPHSDYLDIPQEFTSTHTYRASLGHKINHSFHSNCEFIKFFHPTFGSQVLGVRALKDISTGEEFTVNYKYDVMDSPEWFQQLYLDI